MHTLIIGAGPAGLAIAGQLAHRKLPFTVLEASEHSGVAWRNHYDRLHLHTVKEHSALPHFPFPADYPTYVSRLQFVDYLERYAEHFDIKPFFNQKVIGIRQNPAIKTWEVQTETDRFTADRVVVATGYNRVPNQPQLPGQRDFRGIVWHSVDYRNGAPFRNENVLIVGMGNTGAELALDLLEHQAKPFISVRGPVNIVRRDTFGKPTQPTAIFLSKFPNWFFDFMAGLSQRLTVGDLSAYGLGKPKHSSSFDTRRGKIPVIDVGTLDQIKAGNITVLPGIERINRKTVTFTDGRELPFDAIILATGYRPGLSTVLGDTVSEKVLNERGYPKKLWFSEPDLRGLYFLGFTIPITGVLYHLNLDSEKLAKHIAENNFVST
ncbi:flavin-containing monooxygenase [Spirosoma fluviale]|uniref:Predicted flavoprotein CzcO associated with the cation diffusion facilitator CzcD n=1 Tax=Spirosoma fluviale TaxID=1597977 RepID=A0A286FEV1_9BACT|nr:NAD(P)/FAD-dependent oxidoreductase [Spirosoma fluviale]SOD81751.1 Predicted flavoprotein CzcO associated with the cation diffusion facilitator CzcD [Spirosoma fluviale]